MIDLDGRQFSPSKNSKGGRVASDAVFTFTQTDNAFCASYRGSGFSDGHLIGNFTNESSALLVYHCRADTGQLQAGQARAEFTQAADGKIRISMDWQWLNGGKESGQSLYEEINA